VYGFFAFGFGFDFAFDFGLCFAPFGGVAYPAEWCALCLSAVQVQPGLRIICLQIVE